MSAVIISQDKMIHKDERMFQFPRSTDYRLSIKDD